MTRHAVITDYGFAMISPIERKVAKYKLDRPITSIGQAWQVARDFKITHFWLMPGSVQDRDINFFVTSADFKTFVSYQNDSVDDPMFARCGLNGSEVYVGRVQYFGWKVETPLDILATVDYLERVTGVPVEWSSSYMGKGLFKSKYETTSTGRSKIAESDVDLHTMPFMSSAVYWMNPNKPRGKFAHHVDRNMSYTSTCKTVYTGVGTPTHLTNQGFPMEIGHHIVTNMPDYYAGTYRIKWAVGESLFDGEQLPLIIPEGQEWVNGDVLGMAKKEGYQVDILEAWVFEESHQLFRTWADKICAMRDILKKDSPDYCYKTGRENAYNTIKAMAVSTIGSFGSDKVQKLRRPNWHADIVGKARCTVLNAAKKFQGLKPLLICADDIWFESDEANIDIAMSSILINRDKPGGYKPKHTVALTPGIVQKLYTLSPIAAHTYLKNEVCNG